MSLTLLWTRSSRYRSKDWETVWKEMETRHCRQEPHFVTHYLASVFSHSCNVVILVMQISFYFLPTLHALCVSRLWLKTLNKAERFNPWLARAGQDFNFNVGQWSNTRWIKQIDFDKLKTTFKPKCTFFFTILMVKYPWKHYSTCSSWTWALHTTHLCIFSKFVKLQSTESPRSCNHRWL